MALYLRRLIGPALAAFLVLAPTAAAALVYDKQGGDGASVWIAGDDGSNPRKLVDEERAFEPHISPDGQTVVFGGIPGPSRNSFLMKVPAAGGTATTLMGAAASGLNFAWSPDSKTITTVVGSRLLSVDVASGAVRTITSAHFGQDTFRGVRFSPSGERIVYSRITRLHGDKAPSTDVFTARLTGGPPTQITHGGTSSYPVWGPATSIVFERQRKPTRGVTHRDLYTVRPDGGGLRRLTDMDLTWLQYGLHAVDWSADGKRLLAEFEFRAGGKDYVATVNPATGRVHPIDPRHSFIGVRLSKDGRTILADSNRGIVSYPYAGGHAVRLGPIDGEPDWNR